MAEGSTGPSGAETAALIESDAEQKSRLTEFLQSRSGILKLLFGLGAFAWLAVIAVNFSQRFGLNLVERPYITTLDAWTWMAAAACLFLLPLLLLWLDPKDNMATGPGLGLPLVTVAILVLLAAGSAAIYGMRLGILPEPANGFATSPALLTLVFGLLGISLIARISNACLFAWYQSADRKQRALAQVEEEKKSPEEAERRRAEVDRYKQEHGDAESVGALLATLVVGAIIAGAFVVGNLNGQELDRAVGISVTFAVIGLFAAIVFSDWLSGLPVLKTASKALNGSARALGFVAGFYNLIDTGLVRIGAHVAGVSHLKWPTRYFVLAATLFCLVVMAWCLPEPLGLIPAGVGLIVALSVSRLWSWVEEDRNIATITRFDPSAPIRVGFNEDFRDEALLGFIFVFLLIPAAMKQADIGLFLGQLYTADPNVTSKHDPLTWLSFFGLELAKALPIVDWADIYVDRGLAGSLRAESVEARHFTFAARALVDLVLVAALVQALGVSARNRQQKTLYAARKIRRLDEILEDKELRRSVKIGTEKWHLHPVDFRHYDESRLKELYSATDDVARMTFIGTIFRQAGKTAETAIRVLEELAKSQAPIDELKQTFQNVMVEHQSAERKIEAFELLDVFGALRANEGMKDFKFEMIAFAKKVGPPKSFAQLAEQVVYDSRRDQHAYARQQMARGLVDVVPNINDPSHVAELLAKHVAARSEILGTGRVGKKISSDLLKALTLRLQEIGPPSISN